MSKLFSPLTIKGVTFKNRLVVSPMCQYSSVDGFANDWHLVHLGSRAIGGAGLVIQEATAVVPAGRITADDMGLWKDEHIEKSKQITDFIHQNGSVAGVQLAHAGRKASHNSPFKAAKQLLPNEEGGWQTVAPSQNAFVPNEEAPEALTVESIAAIVAAFKASAKRALEGGYKVVEIHAAHGYLVHQFLSPLSNFRTDAYGGIFENRIRFLLEIIDAVNEVWPAKYPLFVRISATDWVEGGWNVEESIQLAQLLKRKQVDLIDCSTGGNVTGVKIKIEPGYQVQFAEKIKKEAQILTGAVGIITTAPQAEQILQSNQADLIFMARELLRNPYFPLLAAIELGDAVTWPLQYERAKR